MWILYKDHTLNLCSNFSLLIFMFRNPRKCQSTKVVLVTLPPSDCPWHLALGCLSLSQILISWLGLWDGMCLVYFHNISIQCEWVMPRSTVSLLLKIKNSYKYYSPNKDSKNSIIYYWLTINDSGIGLYFALYLQTVSHYHPYCPFLVWAIRWPGQQTKSRDQTCPTSSQLRTLEVHSTTHCTVHCALWHGYHLVGGFFTFDINTLTSKQY